MVISVDDEVNLDQGAPSLQNNFLVSTESNWSCLIVMILKCLFIYLESFRDLNLTTSIHKILIRYFNFHFQLYIQLNMILVTSLKSIKYLIMALVHSLVQYQLSVT